jgi:hypothetical protein
MAFKEGGTSIKCPPFRQLALHELHLHKLGIGCLVNAFNSIVQSCVELII